jgi:catalase
MVRSAYTLRPDDDDFTQPGILVREVFNQEQRNRLVETIAGSLLGGVRSPVLERAFDYWKSIDRDVGQRIETHVRAGTAPSPVQGMGEGSVPAS